VIKKEKIPYGVEKEIRNCHIGNSVYSPVTISTKVKMFRGVGETELLRKREHREKLQHLGGSKKKPKRK